MSELLCVWNRQWQKGGVDEKCVRNDKGDYVGVNTGTIYPSKTHYHSDTFLAKVIAIDENQENGMYHLDPKDKHGIECIKVKRNFIGCTMPFREAHSYGDR